jgi:hypothetical protein
LLHLSYLFDRFFTTKEIGKGPGLPIAQSIIETRGGCTGVDNNPALGGARFVRDPPTCRKMLAGLILSRQPLIPWYSRIPPRVVWSSIVALA